MKNRYKTIVIGATFYGASVALDNPESTLIIERTALVGREFADSLNEKAPQKTEFQTKAGLDFFKNLEKEGNANQEGYVYAFAGVVQLCKMLLMSKVPVLFLTEVVKVKKTDELFEVVIFNQNGMQPVYAEQIVDTTAETAINNKFFRKGAKKYLTAVAETNKSVFNKLTSKSFLKFPVELDADIMSAREKMMKYLLKNKISTSYIANTFAYEMPFAVKGIDRFVNAPSCGCYNLLQAFDLGGKFNEGI